MSLSHGQGGGNSVGNTVYVAQSLSSIVAYDKNR